MLIHYSDLVKSVTLFAHILKIHERPNFYDILGLSPIEHYNGTDEGVYSLVLSYFVQRSDSNIACDGRIWSGSLAVPRELVKWTNYCSLRPSMIVMAERRNTEGCNYSSDMNCMRQLRLSLISIYPKLVSNNIWGLKCLRVHWDYCNSRRQSFCSNLGEENFLYVNFGILINFETVYCLHFEPPKFRICYEHTYMFWTLNVSQLRFRLGYM